MFFLTRNTDVTAASVELLTGAGAALLLGCSVNMNVVRPVLQVLRQYCEARAIVLSCPKDASLSPVGPENVLLKDSHGIRGQDPVHDHLSVLAIQRSPFYLVSVGRREAGK